ncbi:DUF1837 domain-containing protein [Archangium sp. Cb G35]|uniref:HamA C-terminal domain-containing protein n=1 Tax=Archangium sp. Cb G35 TaxID=1920190 RepID=UPI001300F88A|nr:DUF1837 domain-containing protein [Archangium sp. Cb G35]
MSKVTAQHSLIDTKANIHCHAISLDGNSMPRVGDLARTLVFRIIDYAIPRKEIAEAQAYDQKHNTSARTAELRTKAKKLFTTISNTGEGGELLLYMLTQTLLKIPQIFCKMPHKTSNKLHYNGADGIHAALNRESGRLALYWCESKLHASIDHGISSCLESIKPFLCNNGGTGIPQERDLQLVKSNIDLNSPELEEAILQYLDPDDKQHNKLEYRGICLVGFDYEHYPKLPNSILEQQVLQSIANTFSTWTGKLAHNIRSRTPLESIEMEVFLIPFPSVESFRAAFLEELRNA